MIRQRDVTPECWAKLQEIAHPAAPAPPPDDPKDEKEFQADVERLARENGWRVYHTRDSRKSVAGFPDVVALRGTREIIAELKVGTNGTDAAQDAWLEAFRDAGREVFVWWPSDWPEIERILALPENQQ